MDIGQLPLMTAMKNRMEYHGARHSVIAQNIANADTPDYVPMDLREPNFGAMVNSSSKKMGMARTNGMHLQGKQGGGSNYRLEERDFTYETNPNDNKVSIEEETQKLSMNQAEYQKVISLYRKTTELFRTAVRPGGA